MEIILVICAIAAISFQAACLLLAVKLVSNGININLSTRTTVGEQIVRHITVPPEVTTTFMPPNPITDAEIEKVLAEERRKNPPITEVISKLNDFINGGPSHEETT